MKLPKLGRKAVAAVAVAATLIAGPMVTQMSVDEIGPEEGLRLQAYQDIVNVWTICRGSTAGVKRGDVLTKAECDTRFVQDLRIHEVGMRGCLKEPDKLATERPRVYVGFLDLTYNNGIGAFCNSSVRRLANEGDLVGACKAMSKFNKVRVNGVLVPNKGLTARRDRKVQLCLKDAS